MTTQEAAAAVAERQPKIDGNILDRNSSRSAGQIEFISFSIGEDQYGIEITAVREIRGWAGVTHLPKQPDYVRGVLNLRGEVAPIIDLRCRFGQGKTEATPMHVCIIVQIGERSVGVLADRVLDIVAIESNKIQPVPKVARCNEAELLSGLVSIENGMIALIDLRHLVAAEDGSVEGLAKAAKSVAA